jgi:hypothetical protein
VDKNETIAAILRLPQEFRRRGDITFGALLKETGYPDIHREISVSDLRESLTRNPEFISEWETWSCDKRCHPAWYFKTIDDTSEIGLVDLNVPGTITNRRQFNNIIDGCAEFIKIEIEDYRQNYL